MLINNFKVLLSNKLLNKLFNNNILSKLSDYNKEDDFTNIEMQNLDILIKSYLHELKNIDNNIEYFMNQIINNNILIKVLEQYENVNSNHHLTIKFIDLQIKWIATAIYALNVNPNLHNIELIRDYINVHYNVIKIQYIEYIDYTNENNGTNINDIVAIYKSYLYSSVASYKYIKFLLEEFNNDSDILDYLTKVTKQKIDIKKDQLKKKITELINQKEKLKIKQTLDNTDIISSKSNIQKISCPTTKYVDITKSSKCWFYYN